MLISSIAYAQDAGGAMYTEKERDYFLKTLSLVIGVLSISAAVAVSMFMLRKKRTAVK